MTKTVYADRVTKHQQQFARCESIIERCETIVRWLLITGAVAIAGVWLTPENRWVFSFLGVACLIMAAVVTCLQKRTETNRSAARRMRNLNQQSAARANRDWDVVKQRQIATELANDPVANDLDLFGRCSLFSLICTAETQTGITSLARMMLTFADCDEITVRQTAVTDLAARLHWRQQLQARCARLAIENQSLEQLIAWSQTTTRTIPAIVTAAARLLPFALVMFVALWAIRSTAIVGFIGLIAVLIINVLLTILYSGKVHMLLHEVSPTTERGGTDVFSAPFRLLNEVKFGSSRLEHYQATAHNADTSLKQLERKLLLGNLARNPFTVWLAYIPLQFLTLWDFHIESMLYRWRATSGQQIVEWFDTLGELEAIASLASLKFDHPDWCFAAMNDGENTLSAKQMGHPLLNRDRVGNDIDLGPNGRVMMVTGSNMSGKSTLLRSIGINAVLAGMGGPVCCDQMTLPRVKVLTCMRVGDSIQRGQSLFMAELLRLKAIVDSVDTAGDQDALPLYLLDEILHGTNTAERRIAVESVVGHLLESRAIGAVSTHDLELARDSTLSESFQKVHLRETFSEDNGVPNLTFDYQLRTGLATSTNALQLVRMIGLPIPKASS